MKKAVTQNDRILEHMKTHAGITTYTAFRKYGCTRLPARIHEIEEMGYAIGRAWVKGKNKYGEPCKVYMYFLVG